MVTEKTDIVVAVRLCHELHEASDEMKMITVERRKAEAKGPVLAVRDLEPEALMVTSGTWAISGSVLARGFRLGTSSVSGAGSSQKKRKAVVQKESADTQEYESCQQNDMDVDMDENNEELSFVPSAVSDSAAWHEPKFMCDRQRRTGGLKCYETATILVVDDGKPHTCMNCQNMRQTERKDPKVSRKRWRIMVGEKSSRCRCSACLEATGFENKMWERYATKKIFAKGLLHEAATPLQLGKSWPVELAAQRRAGAVESDGIWQAEWSGWR